MRVLVVDRSAPADRLEGNQLIGYHLFRRLRQHHLTLICPTPPGRLEQDRAALAEVFDRVLLVSRPEQVPYLAGCFEPPLSWTRARLGRRFDAEGAWQFQRSLNRLLASEEFDVVHVRQLPMAAFASQLPRPRLLELIDSMALQAERRLGDAVGLSALHRRLRCWLAAWCERKVVRSFQACTTVADADAAAVRRLVPGVPVHVVPNGVDTDYLSPWPIEPEAPTVVFVGAMSYPPNVEAADFFYRTIWPRIRELEPAARFFIVGRDPSPAVQELGGDPSVVVTGYVEDIRPWLARAAVVVCPMVSGSGIKNKALEALAMARPVVATPLGVEALTVADGRHLRIGQTPAAFAAAVLELLGDRDARRRLGRAGRDYVLEQHSWDAVARTYDALYADLVDMTAERKEKGDAPTPLSSGPAPRRLVLR